MENELAAQEIVGSLLEVLNSAGNDEKACETVAYALCKLCGIKPILAALVRTLQDRQKQGTLHSYQRPPIVKRS